VARFLLIGIFISLASCSPQTRFNNLVKKYPFVLDDFIISQWDTVIIPELRHDTMFKITPGGHDTFFISKTNTTIIHNNGALGVSTNKPKDTIFLQREYLSPEPIKPDNKWIYLGLTVLMILVLFLGGLVLGIKSK